MNENELILNEKEIIDKFLSSAIKGIESDLFAYLDDLYTKGKLFPSADLVVGIADSLDEVRILKKYL